MGRTIEEKFVDQFDALSFEKKTACTIVYVRGAQQTCLHQAGWNNQKCYIKMTAIDNITFFNDYCRVCHNTSVMLTRYTAKIMWYNSFANGVSSLLIYFYVHIFKLSIGVLLPKQAPVFLSHLCNQYKFFYYNNGTPSGFSWRLKIGQIWGIFKTKDLKIQFSRFEDLKKALFCHVLPQIPDA